MFEAKLTEGVILKKIIESIKDLVTDVNIDITPQGNSPTNYFSLYAYIIIRDMKSNIYDIL